MENKEEFLKELKALLQKYNVTISAGVGEGSDTHGISEEHVEIYSNFNYKTVFKVEGWSLTHEDIDTKQ